jgi:peptidoglycan hydrolase-like protein with peptidoglycan-binding domain
VYDRQERLKELGYYSGSLDGKFASGTQSAVLAFQQSNGLTGDGIAGRATQDKLYSSNAKTAKVTVASAKTSAYALLKVGSQGTSVRKLQVRLAELGYYSGGADGIYGTSTESAVKAFQRNNGLSGDGQAGEQTQKKLYGSSAKSAPRPVATADPNATRSLSIGMEGNDVYGVQRRLIDLNYLNGVADGVFGMETQAAVRAFQANNGLNADGVAGLNTLKRLIAKSAKAAKATATATPAPGASALREGDAGQAVYELQERLYDLNYYSGRVDGRFGPNTAAALRAFQLANGLTADGIAGAATQKALFSSGAKAKATTGSSSSSSGSAATPATATPAPLANYKVLQEGGTGEDVQMLQQFLFDLGYYDGRVDGMYGPSTTKAVRLFQYYNRLTEDGVAGPSTQAFLYSGGAQMLPDSAATPMPDISIVLQQGNSGNVVRQMQHRLFLLRYLEEGDITGAFDTTTTAAVLLFQQRNGLTADGVAGPTTLEKMYSLYAEALALDE